MLSVHLKCFSRNTGQVVCRRTLTEHGVDDGDSQHIDYGKVATVLICEHLVQSHTLNFAGDKEKLAKVMHTYNFFKPIGRNKERQDKNAYLSVEKDHHYDNYNNSAVQILNKKLYSNDNFSKYFIDNVKENGLNYIADDENFFEMTYDEKPYKYVDKKRSYEIIGKRGPYINDHARSTFKSVAKNYPDDIYMRKYPVNFISKVLIPRKKRVLVDIYGRRIQLPYDFLGKRSLTSNELKSSQPLTKMIVHKIGPDATPIVSRNYLFKETDMKNRRTSTANEVLMDSKRYSEWLGKRGSVKSKYGDINDVPNDL